MLHEGVQVVAKRTLVQFWLKHPSAEGPLRAWHSAVERAVWSSPQDIRNAFRSADFVGDNRVIFNIGGNKYRLVVHVSYAYKRVVIKFIGTHGEYDNIDPETV